MKKFVTTMVAGFVGAALLLAVAFATGLVGGTSTTTTVVKGEPASYKVSGGIDAQQIYQDNINGVVEIVSTFPGTTDMWGQSTGEQQGIGTGFVVSTSGDILTNAHVVSESGVTASSVVVVFKNDSDTEGTQVPATIVGSDESTDVALLRIDPSQAPVELTPVTLGDSSQVAVGESVVAIGNPLGLDFSLSTGVVSAVGRELQSPNGATITDGIQTDAAINPGNSGGPLFNGNGEVIGINEQIDTQSGGNEGIGFAVPINTAVQVMQAMQNGQYAPQTQDQTQTQDGYAYPQDGSGSAVRLPGRRLGYAWPYPADRLRTRRAGAAQPPRPSSLSALGVATCPGRRAGGPAAARPRRTQRTLGESAPASGPTRTPSTREVERTRPARTSARVHRGAADGLPQSGAMSRRRRAPHAPTFWARRRGAEDHAHEPEREHDLHEERLPVHVARPGQRRAERARRCRRRRTGTGRRASPRRSWTTMYPGTRFHGKSPAHGERDARRRG